MLTSFGIKNYRLFDQLDIKRLSRVNLFVGKNNAGKSALLEAVELYASNISTKVLADLVTQRQELWKEQSPTVDQQASTHPLRHLFYNHHLPELDEEGITLGPLELGAERIHVRVAAYRVEEDQEGVVRTSLISPSEVPPDLTDLELALIGQENGKTWRVFRLDREIQSESRFYSRSAISSGRELKYVTQVVPTRNMTEEKVASLWDAIALTGIDDEVVTGLKLLEPRIEGVAIVGPVSERRSDRIPIERIPLVKLANLSERLPLRSLGDGAIRLFQIMVALANARDGILLVDEFENGLHWSIQNKLWEMVFRLSERLNVQVFASTHSRDCVKSFGETWKTREKEGAFYRLSRLGEQSVKLTHYTCETLSDALETDVEVR